MIRVKRIKLQHYPMEIALVDYTDKDELVRKIKECDPDYDWGLAATFSTSRPIIGNPHLHVPVTYMVINSSHPDFNMDAVLHECEHVKNKVMSKIGHKLKTWKDEPYAYMAGFIGQEAMLFYGFGKINNT